MHSRVIFTIVCKFYPMVCVLFQTPSAIQIIEQADDSNIIKCRHVMRLFFSGLIISVRKVAHTDKDF